MSVYDAKGVRGEQRFYLFGAHPATARLRAELETVKNLPETRWTLAMREYLLDKLYAFEKEETDAKIRWLEHEHRQRLEDLAEFAWHDRSCAAVDGDGEWRKGNDPCSCGYDETMAKLRR